jgi:hypothetical protein
MYNRTEERGMTFHIEGSTVQPTMMMVVEVMPHVWASVKMVNRADPQGPHEDSGGVRDDHGYDHGYEVG